MGLGRPPLHFILAFFYAARIIGGQCPNSLVVKHVLGKDESQVRFLLRAPEIHHLFYVCSFLFRSCMFNTLPSQKLHNPQHLTHFWRPTGT